MRCLTIVIPALDEEKVIALTVNEILPVARRMIDRFQIILVNDGSSDKTGQIMNHIAQDELEVQVIHNPEPRGLGWVFREGIAKAHFDSLTLIPGDHAYNIEGLKRLFEAVGSADLVISYRTNQIQTRARSRALISRCFGLLMSLLFRYRLRDFHSAVVYPVRAVRELKLRSGGYTYQLETLVKLLRCNMSFVSVPVSLNPSQNGNSQALRLKTLLDVIRMLWHLLRQPKTGSAQSGRCTVLASRSRPSDLA